MSAASGLQRVVPLANVLHDRHMTLTLASIDVLRDEFVLRLNAHPIPGKVTRADWNAPSFTLLDDFGRCYLGEVVAACTLAEMVDVGVSFTPALHPEATVLELRAEFGTIRLAHRVPLHRTSSPEHASGHPFSAAAALVLDNAETCAVGMQQTLGPEHVLQAVVASATHTSFAPILEALNLDARRLRTAIRRLPPALPTTQAAELAALLQAAAEHHLALARATSARDGDRSAERAVARNNARCSTGRSAARGACLIRPAGGSAHSQFGNQQFSQCGGLHADIRHGSRFPQLAAAHRPTSAIHTHKSSGQHVQLARDPRFGDQPADARRDPMMVRIPEGLYVAQEPLTLFERQQLPGRLGDRSQPVDRRAPVAAAFRLPTYRAQSAERGVRQVLRWRLRLWTHFGVNSRQLTTPRHGVDCVRDVLGCPGV
jgi:hypothetical protein